MEAVRLAVNGRRHPDDGPARAMPSGLDDALADRVTHEPRGVVDVELVHPRPADSAVFVLNSSTAICFDVFPSARAAARAAARASDRPARIPVDGASTTNSRDAGAE
jgi:hypothetical protein